MSHKRLALLLFVATSLAAGLAIAGTSANTPASACVASSGTLAATSAGGAQNTGSVTATAVCPVDRIVAPTLSTQFSASVWVLNQSSTGQTCCYAYSKNPLSGAVQVSHQCTPIGASSTAQEITTPVITDTTSYSHFYVQCSVPAVDSGNASAILNYRSIQS